MASWIVENETDDTQYFVTIDGAGSVLTTVTASGEDAHNWIQEILRIHARRLHFLAVGLDIEWCPHRKNVRNPVAVLQLCVGHRCLVFQLLHADFIPVSLANFLADGRFTFLGVGIGSDVHKLRNEWSLPVANAVDIIKLAVNKFGRKDLRQAGLKTLATAVMGVDMDKPQHVRRGWWDNKWLDLDQIKYACVDAFLSFEVGRRLLHWRES